MMDSRELNTRFPISVNSSSLAEDPTIAQRYANFFKKTPYNTYEANLSDTLGEPGSNRSGDEIALESCESGAAQNSDEVERGHWGSRWEFVLSCIGLSVGIGNVWRFPYLAYSNGGGAFLIPYVILLLLVGKPMYFMETALGQFSQLGPVAVWRMAPIFRGVGFAMVTVSVIVAIYYNIIMSYTVFYTAASLTSELPWSRCQEWWGADEYCFTRGNQDNDSLAFYDVETQLLYFNGSRVCNERNSTPPCVNVTLQTASKQYWEKYVLGLKVDGLSTFGDIGQIRWQLLLCFFFSWIVVFLCVMKGVKSSGKVVYFTATFPYVILIALLIRGVTLEGAIVGIKYFFIPEWSKLLDFQVWRKAAEQMFFSLSISWGGLIMFGSYNQFRSPVHTDALVISSVDFLTSIIAGVATFSILGALSYEMGVDIKDVATSGPGFAFVTFPEAIARLPVPQLWAVLFFIMLFTLGLDSEFALTELFLTAWYDRFPVLRKHKTVLTFATCVMFLLLGLPCVSQAGNYVIDLMDGFGAGTGVILVGIFETIGITWCYGVENFSRDIEFMLGNRISWYWKVCWSFCAPVFLTVIFSFSMSAFENPTMGGQPYPDWAIAIGWTLLCAVVLHIPIWAVITFLIYWKNKKLHKLFQPTESWGPGDALYRSSWQRMKNPAKSNSAGFQNFGFQSF